MSKNVTLEDVAEAERVSREAQARYEKLRDALEDSHPTETDRRGRPGSMFPPDRRRDRPCTGTFNECPKCRLRYCPHCRGDECPQCTGVGDLIETIEM